jgi:hypothetical protein
MRQQPKTAETRAEILANIYSYLISIVNDAILDTSSKAEANTQTLQQLSGSPQFHN